VSLLRKVFTPEYEVKQKELWLYPSGSCISINPHEKDHGYGPYINGVVQNKETGSRGTFLVELSDYSIDETLLLINQNLNFELRHNGPKLKQLALQPKEVIDIIEEYRAKAKDVDLTSEEVGKADFIKENSLRNSFFDKTSAESEIQDLQEICQKETMLILENLISSHAQKCSDLGLPMFMSVCIPPSKKYKK